MTSDGEHALAGLQLVADPAISLNKVSIKPGEQILVNGQSFTPGAQVSVSMGPVDGSIGGNYGTVRADTNGRFSLWVMLASYPDGTPLKPGTIVLLAHTPDFSQKASAQLQITDRAPAAPSDLHITSLAKSTTSTEATVAELQWRDNSGNETGFRIQATFTRMNGGTDSQTWNVAANATGARVNFVAGGINPVTKVCFTVTAFNGQGSSPASNEVCALL
jgi:hypothetical protein